MSACVGRDLEMACLDPNTCSDHIEDDHDRRGREHHDHHPGPELRFKGQPEDEESEVSAEIRIELAETGPGAGEESGRPIGLWERQDRPERDGQNDSGGGEMLAVYR